MTDQHPLTDEILESIHKDYQEAINECDTLICLKIEFDKALRAAADWQLEQCIAWLDDTDCDDPQETAQRLKEAMRPTTTQEDNS